MFHRQDKARPEAWLTIITPSRDGIVSAVACMFPWDWLADLCAQEGIPCVLWHALSRKAIHGGKAHNDRTDAQKITVRLRGGMLPQASVSPAAMRATRDRWRRRMPLMGKRAELHTHIHHTNSSDNLPAMGQKIAYQANRDGVAERFPDPTVHKSSAVDRALRGHDDHLLRAMEVSLLHTARVNHTNTLSLLRTGPGIGESLGLVLLYAMHDIDRCPRGQDCVSDCRLRKCSKESAGKRSGTLGAQIGNAYRTWASSEAAGLFLRDNPAGQTSLPAWSKNMAKARP